MSQTYNEMILRYFVLVFKGKSGESSHPKRGQSTHKVPF